MNLLVAITSSTLSTISSTLSTTTILIIIYYIIILANDLLIDLITSLSLNLLYLNLIFYSIITLSSYNYYRDITIIRDTILIYFLVINNRTLNLRLDIRISTYKALSLLISIVIIN